MALKSGTRLGPYEIIAPLGTGGMGEVYRARDTRLGRDVAVKVLPQHLSASPEDRARFRREAKAISSINHPHICVLHDVGQEGETDYLVMELVEGETLAQRIARGPLPFGEMLKVGAQIADALDRAHRAGVIHRDLKPGNVMLAKDGAKLMDFGLARLRQGTGLDDATAAFPDGASRYEPITAEGMVVGTIPYMAPEQLEGGSADARTDLWALGCVLYEMTTGKRAFHGPTRTSLAAAILRDTPQNMRDLAPMVPPTFDRAVLQCLMKDPDERWQSAGDLRRELQWIASPGGMPRGDGARNRTPIRRRGAILLVVAACLLAVAVLALRLAFSPAPSSSGPVRFAIQGPPGSWMTESAANVALSPDGRAVTYVGGDSTGHRGLWLRRLSDMTPSLLAGTADATYPFWSPDSRNVAFFAGGKLKRVLATGGTVDAVCDAPDGRGGSWGSRGIIVFAPSATSALKQVDADGGRPGAISKDEVQGRYPCFLPDGKHFLYLAAKGGATVGSLGTPERVHIMETTRAPIYASPGYLVFEQAGALVAQRFNAKRLRLEGSPIRLNDVAPPQAQNTGEPVASAASTGVLVFPTTKSGDLELAWLDANETTLGAQRLPLGKFYGVRLSPDGRRIAMEEKSGAAPGSIWVCDIARGAAQRLTFGPTNDRSPVWSPDGTRILYGSNREGFASLRVRTASAGGEDLLLFTSLRGWVDPSSWSRDGNYVTFRRIMSPERGYDIWTMPMRGNRVPVPYLSTAADEDASDISPNGHWLAYESNESGRFEIYVQSFPHPGVKYQVSSNGGRNPLWSRDGRALFYDPTEGATVAVPVSGEQTLQFGSPAPPNGRAPAQYTLDTPTGPRFFRIRRVRQDDLQSLTVVQNWTAPK